MVVVCVSVSQQRRSNPHTSSTHRGFYHYFGLGGSGGRRDFVRNGGRLSSGTGGSLKLTPHLSNLM